MAQGKGSRREGLGDAIAAVRAAAALAARHVMACAVVASVAA